MPSRDSAPFNLVVFGGSQGAQFFSDAIPGAIRLMPDGLRARLVVTQQARPEDRQKVIDSYATLGIRADVAPFFTDMAERHGSRPSRDLPLRGVDGVGTRGDRPTKPARALSAMRLTMTRRQTLRRSPLQGGAQVIPQAQLSTDRIASLLAEAMEGPDRLATMARAAKSTGKPDAAGLLADLVEAIAAGKGIAQFEGSHTMKMPKIHWPRPFHRDRRHRHERDCRGAAQSRTTRCKGRTRPTAPTCSVCAPRASKSSSATRPRTWVRPKSSSFRPRSRRTIPNSSPPAKSCCRSCAAPKCWLS